MPEVTETAPVLDAPRALQLLREVVAERPDYVYEPVDDWGCVYVHDGQPSCIVGHVLVRAGWSPEAFESNPKINAQTAGTLPFDGISPDALDILDAAQLAQDGAKPWRLALADAEEVGRNWGLTA